MGQVLQAGQGQIPSRQAQIKAGIPKEVSSETINKVCASGMRAAVLLDQAIRAGDVEVGVGGGMESMSNAPYLLPEARFGFRMGDAKAIDAMIHDGLTQPVHAASRCSRRPPRSATELELTRPDMDRWALRSHERAIEATDEGRLPEEIVPVTVKSQEGRHGRRGRRGAAARDSASRRWPSCRRSTRTARTPPATRPGVNDGAGALVARQRRVGRSANGKEAARRRSSPTPRSPTTSPTSPARRRAAAKKALEKAGLTADDIDLWEINEAFASVTLNSIRVLGIDEDKVNVNGGAVALGHPIGASGARILGALVHELRRRGGGWAARRSARAAARATPSSSRSAATAAARPAATLAPVSSGAAFFDLDRTLMAGSSAFQFGARGAPAGLMSRRRSSPRTRGRTSRFRLQGSTDEATDELRDRVGQALRGRARCATSSGWGPRCSPACCRASTRRCCEIAYDHQDAGRPVYIVTAASQEMADLLAERPRASTAPSARARRSRRRRTTPAAPTARSPTARARRWRCGSWPRARASTSPASCAYSDSRVRPADAARRRPPGRGQPRRRARARRARGGLGGHALRALRRRLTWPAAPWRRWRGRAARGAAPSQPRPPRGCARGRRRAPDEHEPAELTRRAARDPRAGAPLRRRGDRAARGRVGPRAPLPAPRSSRALGELGLMGVCVPGRARRRRAPTSSPTCSCSRSSRAPTPASA